MRLHFTGKAQVSGDIWSFSFQPEDGFTWIAGQSLRVEIAGPYGPLEHRFSISSPPSSGLVTITTRLSDSDYKESLANIRPGDTAQGYGLEGDFIWRNTTQPHIFVAAGIGVTPLRAMLAERILQQQPLAATLLYATREQPVPFSNDLASWQTADPQFDVHIFTDTRITTTDILALPACRERLIYVSGPSKMVDAFSTDLLAAGIPPAHILRDQFTGRLPLDG